MRKRTVKALQYTNFTLESHPALVALINYTAQSPGLEPGNYGTWQDYRNEANQISRQWRKIVELVRIVSFYRITDEQVIEESESSWSGRYEWDGTRWEYTTGQYFPVEYRPAAITILKNLINREERKCK